METEIDWNWFPVNHMQQIMQAFDISFPKGMSQCPRPFPSCPGSSWTCNGLSNHCKCHNWGDILQILEELSTQLPKCERFWSQVPPWRLGNRDYESDKYHLGEERRTRQATLQHCLMASHVLIRAHAETLETAATFPYLGLTVTYKNRDCASLH